MNDPQSTPEAAIDDTAFDQKQRDYARRSDEIRTANKAVLFDSLAAAGIETVIVTFDGYGDRGQIENISSGAGDEAIPLPPDRIEIARIGQHDVALGERAHPNLIDKRAHRVAALPAPIVSPDQYRQRHAAQVMRLRRAPGVEIAVGIEPQNAVRRAARLL